MASAPTASTSASANEPQLAKSRRSQFIEKLHDLLENPLDADSLRWASDDSFEVTSNESNARQALSPKFDFRSLSSFIRQLSYYNFKRLSDRRRSTERKAAQSGYIVFTHPTGFFVRGDASKLEGITRKTRNRPEKERRPSAVSTGSAEEGGPPPVWPEYAHPPSVLSFASTNPFSSYPPALPPHYPPPSLPSPDQYGPWRSYPTSAWPQSHPSPTSLYPSEYGFPAPGASPSSGTAYGTYPTATQQVAHRRPNVAGLSPRSKPDDLPSVAAAPGYHPSVSSYGPPDAVHIREDTGGSDYRPSFPTPTYISPPPIIDEPRFSQTEEQAPPSSSSYRATGLPMYNPRGSISGQAAPFPVSHPSFPAPPTAVHHPVAPSPMQQFHHRQASQHQYEAVPSPTYSSDGDPGSTMPADLAHFPSPYVSDGRRRSVSNYSTISTAPSHLSHSFHPSPTESSPYLSQAPPPLLAHSLSHIQRPQTSAAPQFQPQPQPLSQAIPHPLPFGNAGELAVAGAAPPPVLHHPAPVRPMSSGWAPPPAPGSR
ncbi:hypothetical protein JCM11641_005773 [Rhodosporidiobolus odoratus]